MGSATNGSDMAHVILPSNIGFIGLGNMGGPMFANLVSKISASSTVHFYDVSPEAMEKGLKDSGAVAQLDPCNNAREVAERSDVLVSMVPEGKHVRAVYLTPETGVLAASNLSGKILVDSSTIDTATSLEVGQETKSRHPGAFFYDAPVSGGMVGAKKGTITFMIGSTEDDPNLPLLRALMSLMGHNIFTCGGPALGLTAKFCNNYLSSSITLLNAEMFNFAIKSGMDPRVLQKILAVSTGCNRNQERANPVPGLSPEAPASKGYKAGFKIEYVKKDIGLAIAAAERVGAKLYTGPTTWNTYVEAGKDPRCAGMDSKVVYRFIGGEEEWAKNFPA